MKKILIVICIFLISCNNEKKLTQKFIGRWEIKEIEFNNKDYKSYLYSNLLIIGKNGKIFIPETVHFIEDKNSTWSFDNGKLKISTTNLAFKDEFDFSFENENDNHPRSLTLKSDSIYLKLYNLFDLE